MDNAIREQVPRPQDVAEALKTQLDDRRISVDDRQPWELRFLIQLIERGGCRFKINIAMVANRRDHPRALLNALYLELTSDNNQLSLCWSEGINHAAEKTLVALSSVYTLGQLLTDIATALGPYRIDLKVAGSIASEPLSPEIITPGGSIGSSRRRAATADR